MCECMCALCCSAIACFGRSVFILLLLLLLFSSAFPFIQLLPPFPNDISVRFRTPAAWLRQQFSHSITHRHTDSQAPHRTRIRIYRSTTDYDRFTRLHFDGGVWYLAVEENREPVSHQPCSGVCVYANRSHIMKRVPNIMCSIVFSKSFSWIGPVLLSR